MGPVPSCARVSACLSSCVSDTAPAQVQTWTPNGTAAQKWALLPAAAAAAARAAAAAVRGRGVGRSLNGGA